MSNQLKELATKKYNEQLAKNMKAMRESVEKQVGRKAPSRKFRMPYQITAALFQSFEDDYQTLAVGLIDGALVIVDLVLGVEKHFLEKHPSQISTLAFYDNKALVSGSICGRVNISDLEAIETSKVKAKREPKFSMC